MIMGWINQWQQRCPHSKSPKPLDRDPSKPSLIGKVEHVSFAAFIEDRDSLFGAESLLGSELPFAEAVTKHDGKEPASRLCA